MPVEDVAFEFAALLSLLAREPLALLGLRRVANRPIADQSLYFSPPQDVRRLPRRPSPIDSREPRAILEGIGWSADDDETADAALAAVKLYYAGLSIARFDPSGAYVSLVSAIECCPGITTRRESSLSVKFDSLRPILHELSALPGAQDLVEQCRIKLIKQERSIKSKFRLFIAEFLPEDFLLTSDQLYKMPAAAPPQDKSALKKVSATLMVDAGCCPAVIFLTLRIIFRAAARGLWAVGRTPNTVGGDDAISASARAAKSTEPGVTSPSRAPGSLRPASGSHTRFDCHDDPEPSP
jgi:hypothetical protein